MPEQSTVDPLIRYALLDYTDKAPPMPYTSDDLIRSGRRSLRRRRAATVGAAAAVTAIALAAIPLLGRATTDRYTLPAGTAVWTRLDPTRFCAVAAGPATVPTAPPTTVTNERNGYEMVMPSEPTERATARLSCHLLAAVPNYLPGARFALDPNAPDGTVPLQVYHGREFDPDRPAETTPPFLSAGALVLDDGGIGSIRIGISTSFQASGAMAVDCPPSTCTVRSGPPA